MYMDTTLFLKAKRKNFISFGEISGICGNCDENITSQVGDAKNEEFRLIVCLKEKLAETEISEKSKGKEN